MKAGKIIIVPKARPAVDFASNLLVIPKDDIDKYVNEIDKHHVEFIRSLEMSWAVTADGREMEAAKMVKEKYEEIIAEKDKEIARLNTEIKEAVKTMKSQDVEIMELKSEADKVIAELKEIDSKNRSAYYKDLAMMAKDVERQKYKRCLAMAEWCNSEMGRETFACFRPRHTKEVWREEHKYWAKWRKIWFELYIKFKEEK